MYSVSVQVFTSLSIPKRSPWLTDHPTEQGSFWVWDQPVRDDASMKQCHDVSRKWRLSWPRSICRMIPDSSFYFICLISISFNQSPDCRVIWPQGLVSIYRCHLTSIGNPIVEIRRSADRLISTVGFPILERWYLLSESGPCSLSVHLMLVLHY